MEESIADRIVANQKLFKKISREINTLMLTINQILKEAATKNQAVKDAIQVYGMWKKIKITFFINAFTKVYEDVRPRLVQLPYQRDWPLEDKFSIDLKEGVSIKYIIISAASEDKHEELERSFHKSILNIFSIIAEIEQDEDCIVCVNKNMTQISKEQGLISEDTGGSGGIFDNLLKAVGGGDKLKELGTQFTESPQVKEALAKFQQGEFKMDDMLNLAKEQGLTDQLEQMAPGMVGKLSELVTQNEKS